MNNYDKELEAAARKFSERTLWSDWWPDELGTVAKSFQAGAKWQMELENEAVKTMATALKGLCYCYGGKLAYSHKSCKACEALARARELIGDPCEKT